MKCDVKNLLHGVWVHFYVNPYQLRKETNFYDFLLAFLNNVVLPKMGLLLKMNSCIINARVTITHI